MYCTVKSRFHNFSGRRTGKTNFDVIYSSGIINLLFDGLTYNTRGHFAHCSYFSSPLRGSENYYATGKIFARNIRVLNHRIRCIYLFGYGFAPLVMHEVTIQRTCRNEQVTQKPLSFVMFSTIMYLEFLQRCTTFLR